MSKVKILLVGSVGGHKDVLLTKLESLQSSKAGPFDVCFCVGPMDFDASTTTASSSRSFPLPVYLQEYKGVLPSTTTTTHNDTIVPLGDNLFYLQGNKSTRDSQAQVLEIKLPNQSHELRVACCSKHLRFLPPPSSSSQQQQHQQCDLLLSSDWPQGMEDVVNVDTEPLSFDVAQVALECRPRYHVAPSSQHFHQSPPYSLPNSPHVGRFLALAPVSSTGSSNKTTKFIHALALAPLVSNPPPTTAPSTLPCPFLSNDATTTTTTTTSSVSLPGFVSAARAQDAGAYSRFAKVGGMNDNGRAGSNKRSIPSFDPPPDDPTLSTLFLYGLHKDVSGQLQSTLGTNSPSHKVFAAFSKYGLISVRYPPTAQTSTYCFLEFPDQSTAMACLLDCQGICVIDSIELTLKWATNTSGNNKRSKNNNDPEQQQQLHYMTLADAADSKTLYFHPPKGTDNDDHFSNALCKYLQQTLEEALNEGNEEERITAETEPALQVQVRRKEQYGFLEFASHAAATMGLAAVTQSTDGGIVQESTTNKPPQPAYLVGATLRWAKGEPPKSQRQQLLEALGLERQFFEKDSRTDCWFCLASPTCETHLITGVYQDWYATMPKGPVHPGHVLLVPVKHTMQGAWTLHDSALEEWNQLLDKLADHASDAYDSDLFIFERAMETRGGYHSHVNVVPIPRTNDTPLQLQTTMMAHAKASGFHLRTIESDLGMSALIRGDRGDEAQYFYAEIRTRQRSHRFLYQHLEENGSRNSRSSVPLQFAREVLAAVLNNPKLAHWKSCVLDTEQEGQLAKDFRDSFKATTGA